MLALVIVPICESQRAYGSLVVASWAVLCRCVEHLPRVVLSTGVNKKIDFDQRVPVTIKEMGANKRVHHLLAPLTDFI